MCLVAFQKIFRKKFSGFWKRRRKRQTQKKNHQRSTLNWVRRCGASRASIRRPRHPSRSEIAISPARSRFSRDRDLRRDLTTARSHRSLINKWQQSHRSSIAPLVDQRVRWLHHSSIDDRCSPIWALSSLSLSFSRNDLKWKWGCKIIYGSKE